MQRVTTPKHTFVFDTDPNEWDRFVITYRQGDRVVLEKTEADLPDMDIEHEEDKYSLSYSLTQSESRKFRHDVRALVQIRAHYPTGKTIASQIFSFDVDEVLNHEILGE